MGDGAEDGRPPTPEERERLSTRGPDRLPAGLWICPTCGEARGEALRYDGQIVRCHCLCENDNRCAHCGGPLAERRLSAWFYDRTRDKVRYLAAYVAFSHRCPEP